MKRVVLLISLFLAALVGVCLAPKAEGPAYIAPPPKLPEIEPSVTPDKPDIEPDTEPEPSAEEIISARAAEILSSMTAREKICQLFLVTPEGLTGVERATVAGEATKKALENYPVGGLIYFGGNLISTQQTAEMIAGAQSFSKLGLLIAADQEGGRVSRLSAALGLPSPGPMYSYRDAGADTARENARAMAEEMAALGFNLDFAPVADVWTDPANTVIGDRAYSSEAEEAAQLIPAAVEGFHEGGVLCTLKHFPGHGDTREDSHTGSAYLRQTRDELEQREWLPFAAGIEAGADLVMVGHLTAPELDDSPATFSHEIMTNILRGSLGFQGVIITDSLSMGAVTNEYTSGDAALKAVLAGADMLLMPRSLPDAVAALDAALEEGTLTEVRLNESVTRILTLKLNAGIIE